ncbi:MAG: hypothetical protein ACRDIB_14105, partial [Ardenticatenaceae bacterium]
GAREAAQARGRLAWAVVAGGAALSALLLLVGLYPLGASDIFDYIFFGRAVTIHGANPYYVRPDDIPYDPLLPYVGWRRATTAYGPLWTLLSAALGQVALWLGDSLLVQVLLYKLTAVVGSAACALLIAVLLKRAAPGPKGRPALLGVYLWSWNPLQLFVTAGNGHNDAVMMAPVLLALWLAVRRRWTSAGLAMLAGALIKFIPVLLVPLLGVVALRQLQAAARRRFIATTAGGSAALLLAAFAPFWERGDMLALARRASLFTTSLPAWVWSLSPTYWESDEVQAWAARGALLLLGGAVWLASLFVWRQPTVLNLVRASTALLLFYLLAAVLWFQPWYAIWPLALAALLPDGALRRASLLLTYFATWKAPLFEYFLATPGQPLPTKRWRERWLFPLVLGPIWLYCLVRLVLRAGLRRYRRAGSSN